MKNKYLLTPFLLFLLIGSVLAACSDDSTWRNDPAIVAARDACKSQSGVDYDCIERQAVTALIQRSAAWQGLGSMTCACRWFMKLPKTQPSVTGFTCRAWCRTAGHITQNLPPAPRYHQRRPNLPPAHPQLPRPRPAWHRIHPIPNRHKTKFRHGLLQSTQFSAPKSQMVHSSLICA